MAKAGKKAKLRALREQEAWLEEQDSIRKKERKLVRKLQEGQADPGAISKRLQKLQRRKEEMHRLEQARAAATVSPSAAAPSMAFSLKKTPTTGISKTNFDGAEVIRRAERSQRFCDLGQEEGERVTLQEVRMSASASDGSGAMEDDEGCWAVPEQIFGTSTALEKPYLRLTSAPPMDSIRPPEVLDRALALAKRKWQGVSRANRHPSQREAKMEGYAKFCEQMKSVRQDLTVQHVKSDLTVAVYETHARVALEVDDMAEYTQCAGCLRRLYAEGLVGQEPEFTAYGLLTAAHQGSQSLSLELLALAHRRRTLVEDGSDDLAEHECVAHAVDVAAAVRSANFHRFFCLYASAPRMSAYLMDAMLGEVRAKALRVLIAAHGTDLDLKFVAQELGFDTEAEAAVYATQNGAVIDKKRTVLDPKASKAKPAGPALQ